MTKTTLKIFGVAVLLWAVLPACALAETRPATAESQPDSLDVPTLVRQLMQADRAPKSKADVAAALLAKGAAQGVDPSRELLKDPSNPSAQIAVADAIAATGIWREEFIDPLLAMLQNSDPGMRASAASALSICKSDTALNRLTKLARDAAGEESVRLSAMSALSRIPDKRSAEVLVALLDCDNPTLRGFAAEGLGRLTGITAFGPAADRWRTWWQENKNKSREQWLGDLADSLSRQNSTLASEKAQLSARLTAAMSEIYNATAAADRANVIVSFLKDPQPEVRLAGLQLANRRTTTSGSLPKEAAELVRSLLADEDVRVRSEAAALEAVLNDPAAPVMLLGRLQVEAAPSVRQSLVTALGTLRVQEAMGPLLKVVSEEPNATAAAAALAIQRLAEKAPLAGDTRRRTLETIQARYRTSESSQSPLREALLGVMGALGGDDFSLLIHSALQDKVATVRLAAVRALQARQDATAAKDILPLLADGDRGVRQASITALGALGALDALESILNRTRADIEVDPGVRLQAWDTSLDLLGKAPTQRLSVMISLLAGRTDAQEYRVKLLGVLLNRELGEDEQINARLELAEALQALGRPAEAAVQLNLAMKSVESDPARSGKLWLRWIESLLAADDASCLATMAQQTDEALFASAAELLTSRLDALQDSGKHEAVIAMADQAATQLKDRLSAAQQRAIIGALERARRQQLEVDRARVAQLVQLLCDSDPAVRAAAKAELETLPKRAAVPLVEQLKDACAGATRNSDVEALLCGMLAKIAPELTGFDVSAVRDEKVKVIDQWLAKLNSAPALQPEKS